MIRTVVSIIVGYMAIAAIVFISFSAAYMVLGSEGAFKARVYELTLTWAIMAVVVNLVAALVGGIVCAAIARKAAAPMAFAVIVFVLGLVFAMPTLLADDETPPARPEGISMTEAMKHAKQPAWFALANPFIAAAGIMLGASLVRRRNRTNS